MATANLSAMTLFLWHQTAFVAVCAAGLLAGRVPGLLTAPAGPSWIAERLAWLPAFAAVLAAAWLVLRRTERARPGTRRWPPRPRGRYARPPESSPAVAAGVGTTQPRRAR